MRCRVRERRGEADSGVFQGAKFFAVIAVLAGGRVSALHAASELSPAAIGVLMAGSDVSATNEASQGQTGGRAHAAQA